MSKCRNAEKNAPSLNALNQLCSPASPASPASTSTRVPTSTTQIQQGGAATVISTAGRRGNCDKYDGRGGPATSRVPRLLSICRCRFPIYPILQVCSFFDRLPDCQPFMIYFITLQGSFPQKNGVLIKILLRTRNNGSFIEINSARKA